MKGEPLPIRFGVRGSSFMNFGDKSVVKSRLYRRKIYQRFKKKSRSSLKLLRNIQFDRYIYRILFNL